VINHTLLTSKALALYGVSRIKIALLDCKRSDLSARTNAKVLLELLSPTEVISLPYLGDRANTANALKRHYKTVKKNLALISNFATFPLLF